MAQFKNLLLPINIQESDEIQESGKNSGGESQFECPPNTVLVGRYHRGDENGNTIYKYAELVRSTCVAYNKDILAVNINESGKNNPGDQKGRSEFICPEDMILTGRMHNGDENGDTLYQYSQFYFNDLVVKTKNHQWSAPMKESNSTFKCPSDTVITGRRHYGDENGNTEYRYSEVYIDGSENKLLKVSLSKRMEPLRESDGDWSEAPENMVMVGRDHEGDENGMTTYYYSYLYDTCGLITTEERKEHQIGKESGKGTEKGYSEFICPPERVLTGRKHAGDENGNTTYISKKVYLDGQALYMGIPEPSNAVKESSGRWLEAPQTKIMVGRWHKGDENGDTKHYYAEIPAFGKATIVSFEGTNAWKKTIGKLYFNVNGNPQAASAVVIGPNKILTAAHNICNGGVESKDVTFSPQFANGTSPLGKFKLKNYAIMPGWKGSASPTLEESAFDLAIITLEELDGQNVANRTGQLAIDYSKFAQYTTFGYCNKYENRRVMYEQNGSRVNPSFGPKSLIYKAGDMDGGTSGGPLIGFVKGIPYVAGIQSGKINEGSLTYSPDFSSQAVKDFLISNISLF